MLKLFLLGEDVNDYHLECSCCFDSMIIPEQFHNLDVDEMFMGVS
jgi:hypothetical protein